MEDKAGGDLWRARLYVAETLASDTHIELATGQSHYLRNVLRCQIGEHVEVFNGKNGAYDAIIDEINKKSVLLQIGGQQNQPEKLPPIGLAFAPLKRERLDYLVQKAVEMGVTELVPVITQRTQGGRMNMDKLRANAIEAAEQCERVGLPNIHDPMPLAIFLESFAGDTHLIFCDEADAGNSSRLPKRQNKALKMVLVGPEGGFSNDERGLIKAHPAHHTLALGPRILRADTAIVAALTLVQYSCGDWGE